jgi:catechol 2,3-dioxygenase
MSAVSRPAGEALGAAIHPETTLGVVRLSVSDLNRSRAFYEQVMGLTATEGADGTLAFGAPGGRRLLELRGDTSAPKLDRRAPGLFHLAVLMPTRRDLAFALARLGETRWPLDGASDHLVSEALYLSDPDGNGIDIYRDRPREEWQRADGQLAMATLPVDLGGLQAEVSDVEAFDPAVPRATRVGHVHLQVSDLAPAERFYSGILGFEVMVRTYPGALFVAAGGYHHHIGLNVWQSRGAPPAQPGAIGLRSFEIELPDAAELERVLDRVRAAGIDAEPRDDGALIHDPFGIGVLLSVV